MRGKEKKKKADRISTPESRKKQTGKNDAKIKQYMLSGLLTLVVTAAAIGSFFAIRRQIPSSPFGPGGTIEVEEEVLCAASMNHSAWISGGRLYVAGEPFEDQEAVSDWKRLVQVSVSDNHLVALDHTGQVYAIGDNHCQQCEVDAHQFVTGIAAGLNCTAVVLASGEVLVYGVMDEECRSSLLSEKNVRKVVLSEDHAAVLRKDGTVAAYGNNESGQCDVSSWKDVTKIDVAKGYTVAVTSSGDVLFAGDGSSGQEEAGHWSKMSDIAAGTGHVVGVKKDGTVIAAGRNAQRECEVEGWKDIVSVAAGYDHSIGMDSSGGFFAAGYNGNGQCDVSGL